MIKKVSNWVKRMLMTKEQRKRIKNEMEVKKYLILGGKFIQFMRQDLRRQQDQYMNRSQRRRFQKTIVKGEMSEELVDYYIANAEQQVKQFNAYLNPSKPGQVKIDKEKIKEGANI